MTTKKLYWSKGMRESLDPIKSIKKRSDVIPIKRVRNILGFASIYLIGEQSGRPLKLGYSCNPMNRLSNIQMDNSRPMVLHHVEWVRSSGYSRMLEKECHALLDKANRRRSGEWFDIDVEWGKKVIQVAADKLGYKLYTTAQVNEFLAYKKQLDEDRLCAEIHLALGKWKKEPLKSLEKKLSLGVDAGIA